MADTPAPRTPAVAQSIWNELTDYSSSQFHDPAHDALEAVLCAVKSHYFEENTPVWIQVVGIPGSGKTEIVIRSLETLPGCHVIGDLTPNALLSGKNNVPGLLIQIKSGVLLFKDFTTFLSKRPEHRAELVSQLREIHDGSWNKNTGERSRGWKGKITAILAVTPAIEHFWAIHRDLGERFLIVRWKSGDLTSLADAAIKQMGKEARIRSRMQSLVAKFLGPLVPTKVPEIGRDSWKRIIQLSVMVARARAFVQRDHKRDIEFASPPEAPTRIAKGLATLVAARTILWGRPGEVEDSDIAFASRIALDSIPDLRRRILEAVSATKDLVIGTLADRLHVQRSTVRYHLDDLKEIGLLRELEGYAEAVLEIDDGFLNLLRESKPADPSKIVSIVEKRPSHRRKPADLSPPLPS